jgi:hypothetical protein
MHDETWCTTRDGRQLETGQIVAIMSPVRGHQGYGTVTRLLPGGPGDVPCVMVADGYTRRIVVNAVNVTIDEGFADLIAVDEIEHAAGLPPARQ